MDSAANDATNRGISDEAFDMIVLLRLQTTARIQTPREGGYSETSGVGECLSTFPEAGRPHGSRSHRRGQAVAAHADAVGFIGAVGELFHERDHLGARLQIRFVAGDI